MLTTRLRGKTYHIDLIEGHKHTVRGSLGTRNRVAAKRLARRLENALADGPKSKDWVRLRPLLPPATFARFADIAGLKHNPLTTWHDLRQEFEAQAERQMRAGKLKQVTANIYKLTFDSFDHFLAKRTKSFLLQDITEEVAAEFKEDKMAQMRRLARSRGAVSYPLVGNTMRYIFSLALGKGMIDENPFPYEEANKPKRSARPFAADELVRMKKYAGDDLLPMFLLFRWTGFRRSDGVDARWGEVHFDAREIQRVTIKLGKEVFVPISRELFTLLQKMYKDRQPQPYDRILLDTKSGKTLTFSKLQTSLRRLGERAGVRNVHSHRFRSTFAVDLLLRGAPIPSIARILGDTVDTIVKYYLPYVEELKTHARLTLDSEEGIEKFASQVRHNRKDTPQASKPPLAA